MKQEGDMHTEGIHAILKANNRLFLSTLIKNMVEPIN